MTKVIKLIKGDITILEVDAIVNAANSSLMGGGGVDGAIHRRGGQQILDECILIRNRQGKCQVGDAVYTSAGMLPCSYVIHTVGPIWRGGNHNEANLLASCYKKSLQIAESLHIKSIAFPNISTGVYHYPKEAAAQIAIKTVQEFLEKNSGSVEEIIFICFDDENFEIYEKTMGS